MGWPPDETRRRVQEAYQQALLLDSTLAEVHTVVGRSKMYNEWDWASAEREFIRAIDLNPNYAEAHHSYSHYLMALGRVGESLRESERALQLDPLDLGMNAHLAWHYVYARQPDQAIAQCHKTLDMDANYELAHFFLGQAYEQKGRYLEAIEEFEKDSTLSSDPDTWLGPLPRMGHAYALAGKKAEAMKVIDRLMTLPRLRRPFYGLALVYQGLGDTEKALVLLKEAVDERQQTYELIYLGREPTFDGLRPNPRYADLLRRVGLPQ
jgi:tetratricopeptide (TPR) repeat protein